MYSAKDLEFTPYVIKRIGKDGSIQEYPTLDEDGLALELLIQMRKEDLNKDCEISVRIKDVSEDEIEEWFSAHFDKEGVLTSADLTLHDGNEEFVSFVLEVEEHQWDLDSHGDFVCSKFSLQRGFPESILENF
jgi:hypothetical protein